MKIHSFIHSLYKYFLVPAVHHLCSVLHVQYKYTGIAAVLMRFTVLWGKHTLRKEPLKYIIISSDNCSHRVAQVVKEVEKCHFL